MKQAKSINTKCDKNISKSHHKREAVEGCYPFLETDSKRVEERKPLSEAACGLLFAQKL